MKTFTREELMPFCSAAEHRPTIAQPWTRGGFTIATDGRILIRVPSIDGIADFEGAPAYEKSVWQQFDYNATWIPMPSVPPMILETCFYCRGSGYQECDMGHKHSCPECDGVGEIEKWQKVKIGERTISAKYLMMISALPHPMVAENGDKETSMSFKGDGYEGLLMPMRV